MEVLPLFAALFGARLYIHPQGRSVTLRGERRKTVIPDLILNSLQIKTHRFQVMSGMEVKRGQRDKVGMSMVDTVLQAHDQVKSLVVEERLSNSRGHLWILAEGPMILIRRLGPYTQQELDTKFSQATDSGDYEVTREIHNRISRGYLDDTLEGVNIGTREGAQLMAAAMQEMIQSCPGGVQIDTM